MAAADLGPGTLASHWSELSVALGPRQPAWSTTTGRQRRAAEKEALVEQTGLEFGSILSSKICHPN